MMIIILENIGDICEENPFKKPDKKPENPPTISELPNLYSIVTIYVKWMHIT